MSAPSYEKTLEHYDVSDSEMKVECPDDAIYTLAKKMTRWRSIDLGVDRGVVNGIENERLDDEGKRRQLLERWKERYGHEATYDRLARSFFESERLDLAGAVCKEFRDKNTRTCEGELFFRVLCKLYKSMGVVFNIANMFSVDTQIISGTEIFQTFSAHAPATGDDSASAVGRDVAASPPVETVGRNDQPPPQGHATLRGSSVSIYDGPDCEQEQNPGKLPSDLVTSNSAPSAGAQPASDPPPPPSLMHSLLGSIPTLTTLLEKRESTLEKQDAVVAAKKDKIKELKDRQKTVEGYLSDKEGKIQRMTGEAKQMETKLQEVKEKQEKAQEDLRNKQQRIEQLEGYVYQKDMELQQEKDDKHETCQQLREQLKQAHADLEEEKTAEQKSEKRLSTGSKRMVHLQEDMEKANREVEITRREQEKIKTVLEWMQDDVNEEQRKRQTKYTKGAILGFVCVIFALIAFIVHVVPQYCVCNIPFIDGL